MKVLTGSVDEGWTLNVSDLEYRIIATTFKELMIASVEQPLDEGSSERSRSSMASFACRVYNEMVNARGGINEVEE